MGASQIRTELGSARSLLSFDVKLNVASRAAPHSSGDPSLDSYVVAAWLLAKQKPNKSSQRGWGVQEQMAVFVHMHISVYV